MCHVAWLVACVDRCYGHAGVDIDGWCVLEEREASSACTVTLGGRTRRRREHLGWSRRACVREGNAVLPDLGNGNVSDEERLTNAMGRRPMAVAALSRLDTFRVTRYRDILYIYYISSRFHLAVRLFGA